MYKRQVATSNTQSEKDGTGDLTFHAHIGDTIRFHGISVSNNFNHAVLLYDMTVANNNNAPKDNHNVFSPFNSRPYIKTSVLPSGDKTLPANNSEQTFWFLEASVEKKGTELYNVVFALYERDDNQNLNLLGYFQWDPKIVVKS